MEKILISACLAGEPCRYDGSDKKSPYLEELNRYFDLVPFCSEVEGGLATPRSPSEIKNGRVYNEKGENLTKQYNIGAEKALKLCKLLGIHICILKDKSPACGVYEIYDGSFSNKTKKGKGVTASLLSSLDFWVLSEDDIPMLLEKQRKKREIIEERTASIKAEESLEKGEESEASSKKPFRSHYGDKESRDRRYIGKKPYREGGSYEAKDYRKPFHRGDEEGNENAPYKKGYSHNTKRPYRKSYGGKPYGDRKSYGDKPYRKAFRKEGESDEKRPFKESYGDEGTRPYRKSHFDKPYGERKNYAPRKSYGDKPYGEGKSRPERRTYGDKKPYGERRSYGGKKPYGKESGFKKSYPAKKAYKKDSDE